ncbi:MAG: hypothetical protein JW987_00575 [Anaerolineaceae bacterium]|nr:hypothetical protein [Anaerolineaceae bacterium]
MPKYDFSVLFDQYPAIIALMPETFGSHEFILALASHNQAEYVQALYAYRDSLHEGTPAPFKAVHQQLSSELKKFPNLVTLIHSNMPSKDIFGHNNTCAEWKKV